MKSWRDLILSEMMRRAGKAVEVFTPTSDELKRAGPNVIHKCLTYALGGGDE